MWLELDIMPLLDVYHLSPSPPSVFMSQAVNTFILYLCSCVFLPICYCLSSGSFIFVLCNKTKQSEKDRRGGVWKPMLKVKPRLSVLLCKYFYDCKLNSLYVYVEGTYNFLINRQKTNKKNNKTNWLKAVINMKNCLLINLHFECILLFLHEDILNCKINGCLTYFWRSLNGPSLLLCVVANFILTVLSSLDFMN